MNVKTLDFLMAVANLPIGNYTEVLSNLHEANVDINKISTRMNIFKDALSNKELVNVVSMKNPYLYDAILEVRKTTVPCYFHLLLDYTSTVEYIKTIIKKYNLPEISEINGQYSLQFAIVLITEITDLPGYDYQTVVDFYRQNNPNISDNMMATVLGRGLSQEIYSLAFEFRDWWKEQEKSTDLASKLQTAENINSQLEFLQKKYYVQSFIKA